MRDFTFIKEPSGWFVDLPEYIEQGGTKADLAMVEGADTMLDIIGEGKAELILTLDERPFEGAEPLELIEKCDPDIGGGYYLLRKWNDKQFMQRMWLCGVTEFVFGHLPEKIFIRKVQ